MSTLNNIRIIHKHDTEENWLKAINFIPLKGELIIYDIDDQYDYERFKIGDGKTNVNLLPFGTEEIAAVQDDLDAYKTSNDIAVQANTDAIANITAIPDSEIIALFSS